MLALFVMIVFSVFGLAPPALSGTESNNGYTQLWPNRSCTAVDAGMRIGLSQLSADAATSGQAIAVTAIGAGAFTYQLLSGHLTDAGPSPVLFKRSRVEAGYNLVISTGYDPSGYVFHRCRINTTGLGAAPPSGTSRRWPNAAP